MKHINVVSRAQIGSIFGSGEGLDLLEIAIMGVITAFFSGWDNYASVISNLQKFYRKT